VDHRYHIKAFGVTPQGASVSVTVTGFMQLADGMG
jgi:hypothetical protein